MDVDTDALRRRVRSLAGLVQATLEEAELGGEWAGAMHQHLLAGKLMTERVNDAIVVRAARGINPVTPLGREYLDNVMARGKAGQVVLLAALGIAWQSGVLVGEVRRWLFDRASLDRTRVKDATLAIIEYCRDILLHVGAA